MRSGRENRDWCWPTENAEPVPAHIGRSLADGELVVDVWGGRSMRASDVIAWGFQIDEPDTLSDVPRPLLTRLRDTAESVRSASVHVALTTALVLVDRVHARMSGARRMQWAEFFGRRADEYCDRVSRSLDKHDHEASRALAHLERAIALDPELEHAYQMAAELLADEGTIDLSKKQVAHIFEVLDHPPAKSVAAVRKLLTERSILDG